MLTTRSVESVYQSRTPEFKFQTSLHGDPVKRLLFILIAGALLTSGLMLWAAHAEILPQPLAVIYFFAVGVGAMVCKDVHQPNPGGVVTFLFVFFSLLTYLLMSLYRRIRGSMSG